MLSAPSIPSPLGANPKQIVNPTSSPVSSIMYTVPVGRKFVGQFSHASNTYYCDILTPSGTVFPVYAFYGQSTVAQAHSLVPFTLLAGTSIREGGANASTTKFIGIESDA